MVPGYQIEDKVFQTPHTAAFRALVSGSGRRVLIKLPCSGSDFEQAKAQIRRELALCARLAFPGKLAFKAVELADGTPLLEAELEHRVFLRERLNQGLLSLEDALLLAVQLAENLFQLHRQNVILGRLGPDVLLFDERDKALYFADLSCAGRTGTLDGEQDALGIATGLEPLAYLAPEQTGRFSRSVDARADVYAAGVLCYEMLTGRLPVPDHNPLEWFHAVATREIPSPSQLNPRVPESVARIVLRCLTPDPESRYQSAYGLKKDLERCLAEWRRHGRVSSFPLACHDVTSVFRVTEGFYGRDEELKFLRTALERAAAGGTEVVLVAGEAGVGKTRLLQEFRRRARGWATFGDGKFPPLPTEAQYRPVAQAFEHVLSWILSQGKEEAAAWKERLLKRLGVNLSLVAEIVPGIEQLTGELPEAQVGSSLEAQERLHHALSQLMQLSAVKDRPLVLILDDLQWADRGSLRLLEAVLAEGGLRHVLVLGAYREAEVPKEHIVRQTAANLQRLGVKVQQLALGPVQQDQVEQMVASTLCCSREEAKPLARFLQAQTGGNPLFIKEVLHTMFRQGLIVYKPESGGWQWDLHGVKDTLFGGDVVGLLLQRIELLPAPDKNVLCLAACIGTHFSPDLVAELAGQELPGTAVSLSRLVEEGLLQRGPEGTFSFVHDRVHQAAYQLVSASARPAVHYRLAHLLLGGRSPAELEGKAERAVFLAAVNHLNLGLGIVQQRGEELQAARLNLLAGRQAKQTAAFPAAREYFRTALAILPDKAWEEHHTLTFQLNLEYLECLYLCGDFAAGDAFYQQLEARVEPKLERTKLYLIKILFATKKGFNREAIQVGIKGLRELGCLLPEKPSLPYMVRELIKVEVLLRRGGVKRLTAAAPAVDPEKQAACDLLIAMGPCVYNLDDDLLLALSLKICELSLRYGGFPNSANAYITLAMVYIVRLKNFNWGRALGRAALYLAEQYSSEAEKSLVNFLYGAFCLPWLEHIREAEPYLTRAKECGLTACDLTIAGYAMTFQVINAHFQSVPLAELARQIEENLAFAPRIRDPYYRHTLTVYRQFVRTLQGLTKQPDSFSDETLEEEDFLGTFQGLKVRERDKFDYYLLKGQLCYLLEEYDQARLLLAQADRLRALYFGEVYLADLDFYTCLTLLACYERLGRKERASARRRVAQGYRRLRDWARRCPANFAHKQLLVAAELARVRHRWPRAARLYEAAAASARKHGYVHATAVACECAARFHLAGGLPTAARKYLEEAREGYRQWGAVTKVRQLDRQHPWLPKTLGPQHNTEILAAGAEAKAPDLTRAIDIDALLRSTRILSQEIRLEKLLQQMMYLLAQDAGAESAVLLLEESGELYVEAVLKSHGGERRIEVLQSLPVNAVPFLPRKVVCFVAGTRQMVVLDKAAEEEMFYDDAYIAEQRPASLLCLPIVHQNQLVGVLYLENRRTAGCFHPARAEVLKLLSGQIAISIENARLYRRLEELNATLEEKVKERTAELAQVHRETVNALVEQSRLEERNRIAREIHDTLGHTLTGVLLQIEAGKRLLVRDSRRAQEKMQAALEQVRRGLDEVRRSVHLLHEDNLEDDTARLAGLLQAIMQSTGVSIKYRFSPGIKLSPTQRHVIYRALQEGITNGIRHGHSRSFDFQLTVEGEQLRFVLKDYGRGAEKVEFGFGLSSMRERAAELAGTLQVDTRPGEGLSITLTLPLSHSA
jgi:predicted ATPase/signal transduction histidine kinase